MTWEVGHMTWEVGRAHDMGDKVITMKIVSKKIMSYLNCV